jgi:hypothetical protein
MEPARALGIDAYHVMSAQDMLLNSALYELLLDVPTLGDSLMLGTFAAAALNSPFALCKGKGRLTIEDLDAVANFFTPMLQCFMQWLIALASRRVDDAVILFLARDGYLVKELYDFARVEFGLKLADGVYALSSRSALADEYASRHGNYLRYLEKIGISDYKNIIAYDLVTKGTSLRGLSRLTGRAIELACFATFNIADEAPDAGRVHSMLGDHNFYDLPLNFLKYYELLEILSAPKQTQFLYFDDELNAVFADESSERGKRWDDVAHIQKCIEDAISALSFADGRWYAREPRIAAADRILGLISTKYAMVSDEVKRAFVFESHSENVEPTEWWDRLVD